MSEPVRIGVTTESYGHPMHPDIVESIERSAEYLSDAGYAVERVVTPSVNEAAESWLRYVGNEIKTYLMPVAMEHGSETIQQIFEWFFQIGGVSDAEDYREGIKERTAMTREWNLFLEKYPLILSPYLMQPVLSLIHISEPTRPY